MKVANTIKMCLVFLVLFTITGSVNAQKCKYKLDKTDPMTSERVRRSEIKMKNYFIVSYYRKADEMRVELNVRYVGERNFIVAKGSEINLKLGNDKILILKAAQKATPVSYASSAQIMTTYAVTYHCSKEEMQKLADHGFKVVQVKLGDETLTYEVKSKDVEDSAQKATCMLKD